jgi:hypothetical protein
VNRAGTKGATLPFEWVCKVQRCRVPVDRLPGNSEEPLGTGQERAVPVRSGTLVVRFGTLRGAVESGSGSFGGAITLRRSRFSRVTELLLPGRVRGLEAVWSISVGLGWGAPVNWPRKGRRRIAGCSVEPRHADAGT